MDSQGVTWNGKCFKQFVFFCLLVVFWRNFSYAVHELSLGSLSPLCFFRWKKWDGKSSCILFETVPKLTACNTSYDLMHCKFLGSDQVVFGSCVYLLCFAILDQTPLQNLRECWNFILQYYKDHQIVERYRGMTKLSLFMKKRVVQSWRAGLHRCNTLQHLFVLCGRAKWIHMWKFTERFWHYSKQVWKWTNCSKLLSTNLLLILRKQKDSRNVHLLALKFTEICLSTLQRKRSLYLLPFPKSMRRCIVLWLPSTWTLDLHGASDKKTAWMCAEFWQKAAVKESRVL